MTPASRHGAENPAMADQAFDEADAEPGTDIAVIGMAGRFPGADDVPTFWRNLREGVESIRPLSDDELRERGVPEATLADPAYVKAAARLEGVDRFDAAFFEQRDLFGVAQFGIGFVFDD